VGVYQNSGVGGTCRVRPVRVYLAKRVEQKRIVTPSNAQEAAHSTGGGFWKTERSLRLGFSLKAECYTMFLLYICLHMDTHSAALAGLALLPVHPYLYAQQSI